MRLLECILSIKNKSENPESEFLDINTQFDYKKALVFEQIYKIGENNI